MAFPGVQDITLPLLRYLGDGEIRSNAEIYAEMAKHFSLSEDDLRVLLPSGRQPIFKNRVAWAKAFLKQARILESPARGNYVITKRGKEVLAENVQRLTNKYLCRFDEFVEFKKGGKNGDMQSSCEGQSEKTPLELIEEGFLSIRNELVASIIDTIKKCSPMFFEKLVVDLLIAMGYGGSKKEAGLVTSYANDEGVDGIIKEDRLGLDVVYVQAKKWESSVSRPEIQKFAGALLGKKAKKGVFITTSSFTKEAVSFANSVEAKIVLIDGQKLAEYMIEYGVGVAVEDSYVIKRIDLGYFIEDNI